MYNYGKHFIDLEDIESVKNVLKNENFLTCGPKIREFEKNICKYTGCSFSCAVNSCTSALHLACLSIGISLNDEVIVPAISFAASSNCILYCGGKPVFCDIDPNTMNIDIQKIEKLINERTKAIIVVDFAGQVNDYERLLQIKEKYNLIIIEDAAHSIGAKYKSKYVGNITDLTTFSFHPVKNMTTGEGGAITTNDEKLYKKIKLLRSHGLTKDFNERNEKVSHQYDIISLGYNYRISDILCSLGISQLQKLDSFVEKRKELVTYYNYKINEKKLNNYLEPLKYIFESSHHIYIIKIKNTELINRDLLYKKLHKQNIKVNVHYKPIYLFTLYKNLGYHKGLCPIAEDVYNKIITLPLYYSLNNKDIDIIIDKLHKIIENIISTSNLIKRFEKIDPILYGFLQNDFISGKEFSDLYLEDLLNERSESISLRN